MAQHPHVTVTVKNKAAKGKIRHMEITPADNGITAETHYHPPEPPAGKQGMYMEPPTPDKMVFGNDEGDKFGQHVMGTFFPGKGKGKGKANGKSGGDDEAAEGENA